MFNYAVILQEAAQKLKSPNEVEYLEAAPPLRLVVTATGKKFIAGHSGSPVLTELAKTLAKELEIECL